MARDETQGASAANPHGYADFSAQHDKTWGVISVIGVLRLRTLRVLAQDDRVIANASRSTLRMTGLLRTLVFPAQDDRGLGGVW